MIIGVGSMSKMKLDAAREVLSLYPVFANAKVVGIDVPSGVGAQPMTLVRTTQGAKRRARGAFGGHQFGFGIESGLMPMPGDRSRMIDVCVCVIYDGHRHYIGHSSGFEVPPAIVKLIKNDNLDLNGAFLEMQSQANPDTLPATGVVEFLTNGRVNRIEFMKPAIMMALIPFEHPRLYGR